MSYLIGLDAHKDSCEFAVYKDKQKLVECKKIDTSAEKIIDFIRKYKNPKTIIYEESTLSQWLYEIFEPYFDDIVVSDPYHNSLI